MYIVDKLGSFSIRRAYTKILVLVVAFIIVLGVYWVLYSSDEPVDSGVTDDSPIDDVDPDNVTEVDTETVDVFWESLFGPPGGSVPFLVQNLDGVNELYAGSFPGLFVSHDLGVSFSMVLNASLGEISSLEIYDNKLFFTATNAYVLDPGVDELRSIRDNTGFLWIHGDRLYASQVVLLDEYPDVFIEYTDLSSDNLNWTSLPSLSSIMDNLTAPHRVPGQPFYPEVIIANPIETPDGLLVTLGFRDEHGEYELLVNTVKQQTSE